MSRMKVALLAFLVVLAGMLGVLGVSEKARAACAADWEMGEKSVSFCGGELEDGTFTAKLTGDDETGYVSTVILRDYKGPAFAAKSYGTGFPVNKYVVELHGFNEVTLEDFEQLYMGEMAYELTGEGRLVVRAGALGSSDGVTSEVVDQTKCDDFEIMDVFGVEDAATWVAVRVGIIGGAIAVVAAVAFGVVKLAQEIRKGKE